jgi:hypothetical protein
VLLDDLQVSLRAWRRDPLLPVVSLVVLYGIGILPAGGTGGLIGAILGLLGLGWQGTERLWYRQIFDGTGISVAELWSATWRYFPRYLLLSLLVVLMLLPLGAGAQLLGSAASTVRLVFAVVAAVAAVFLTFVLPALAFTSRRVRDGVRIGWRILKEDWRRCRWYALFPAGASLVASRLSVLEVAVPGPVWTALATVVIVVFDGAVVRYYLRREQAAST